MKLNVLVVFLLNSIVPVTLAASGDDLGSDMWEYISNHIDTKDLPHVRRVSKAARKGSDSAYQQHLFHKYVPGMESYVQAMRRCMTDDNVQCFETVQKHFQEPEPWQINQLPALAAAMGAKKIFLKLGYNETDGRWKGWMERAKSHSGADFQDENFVQRLVQEPQSMSFYDAVESFNYQRDLYPQITILDYFFSSRERSAPEVPSAYEILSIVKMQNGPEQAKEVEAMKETLKELLQSGTYILDDTLKDPSVTWCLWHYYGWFEPIATGFIQWLIQEGAPTDERELIMGYLEYFQNRDVMNRRMPEPFKYVVKRAVKASSGTPARSFGYLLESMSHGYLDKFVNDESVPGIIKAYFFVFGQHIDFFVPSLFFLLSKPKTATVGQSNDSLDVEELALTKDSISTIRGILYSRTVIVNPPNYFMPEAFNGKLETALGKFKKAQHMTDPSQFTERQRRVLKGIQLLKYE